MSEAKIWRDLKKHIGGFVYMQRIDAQSVPDVHLLHPNGSSSWIELKAPRKLLNAGNTLGLRPDQCLWLYQYWKKGGKAFILALIDDKYLIFKGKDAIKFNTGLSDDECINTAVKVFHKNDLNKSFIDVIF